MYDYKNLEEMLREVLKVQKLLHAILSASQDGLDKDVLRGYISENDLKKKLGRGTTWFWNARKSGRLPAYKIGRKTFYKSEDVKHLLEQF